jgi:hypothetical protein
MPITLHKSKLRAVAELARFCVRNPDLLDDKLIPQTLGVAVRKLHDFGECSRGRGKFLGHEYWSRDADALLRKNKRTDKGIRKYLRHEHVVPVNIIVSELLSLDPKAPLSSFEEVISNLSLVAIITREEDAEKINKVKMKDAPGTRWFDTDKWWRYRQAKLFESIIDAAGKGVDA